MSNNPIKKFIHELQIGMYVVELDRPWLETPFLFQGLYIKSQHDIDELSRNCKYVFVDPKFYNSDNNMPSPSDITKVGNTKTKASKNKVDRNNKNPISITHLKQGISKAKQSYRESTKRIAGMMEWLRGGGEINFSIVENTVEQLVERVLDNPSAMMWLNKMKKKDEYIYHHSISSSVWAIIFGSHLGLDRQALNIVGTGAMLMDVGKTKIYHEILVKPGELTVEERKEMRKHVEYSLAILEKHQGISPEILEIVYSHHERHNGTGYPRGLNGNSIPVYGRIAGIVDCYDAMTSTRCYAKSLSPYDAMRTLSELADVEFQAEMVEQFIQALGIFPTGTLLELSNGEVGVVISQNEIRRLRPRIMLILDREKKIREDFPIIDLVTHTVDEHGQQSLWVVKGLEPGAYGIDPSDFFLN